MAAEVPEGAAMEPDAAPAEAAGEGSAPPEPAGAAALTAAAEAAPEEQGAQVVETRLPLNPRRLRWKKAKEVRVVRAEEWVAAG